MIAIDRRLVHDRGAGQLGRSGADAMHLDVIRVPVPAMVVVDGEHVGAFLVEDLCEPLCRVVEVGGPEGALRVVLGCPHHPRVEVTEELDAGHSEDLCRTLGLPHPPLRHRLAGLEHLVAEAGMFAPGCDDEHHSVSFGGRLRHHSCGGDGLVVGVGVEGHERVRHEGILARLQTRPSRLTDRSSLPASPPGAGPAMVPRGT